MSYSNSNTDRGGSRPGLSPEDDRSIVMNPNNPAHDADRENTENQKSGK